MTRFRSSIVTKTGALLVCLLLFGTACKVTQKTNTPRTRLSYLTSGDGSVGDVEAEIRFGRELAARILGNYTLIKDTSILAYVNKIGKAVAQYSGRAELNFYFGVLDSKEINAFAAPGGYVFLTKGALMKMDNEAELASVLAHEIAHISEKHVINRIELKGSETSGMSGLADAVGSSTAVFRSALETALGEATEILFSRGYNIKDEIDADKTGVLMASAAGYDPYALRNYLIKSDGFEVKDASYNGEHPQMEVRMKEINKVIADSGLANNNGAQVKRRFNENVKF